jgi:hypothetical protein
MNEIETLQADLSNTIKAFLSAKGNKLIALAALVGEATALLLPGVRIVIEIDGEDEEEEGGLH